VTAREAGTAGRSPRRVYLLSPADCTGKRASLLLGRGGDVELARRLGSAAGAPLGEVFSFISSLYFRGKLAYAAAFADPPPGCPGALVIAPGRGLLRPETTVTVDDLRGFGRVPVDAGEPRFVGPLGRDAAGIAARLGEGDHVVLLGSIASGKYVDPLLAVLGSRLRFPAEFVGRGDMSRGGLMLRAARAGRPLTYAAVLGAVRRGNRPPRLGPDRGR
jgi:hypothetical protein